MSTTMTLRDGTTEWVERCCFRTQEQVDAQGKVLGWVDENGNIVDMVSDRLNTRYAVQLPDGRVRTAFPLFGTGFEVLTIDDAILLGFTTSEYQAAMRYRLLNSEYIQTEAELAAEQIAPKDFSEALVREGVTDWVEWHSARRVPYPSELWFEGYQAIGWVESQPSDRLKCEYLIRELGTNEIRSSGVWLCEVGVESLSLEDALRLGFNTSEYQAALRVRVLERRHVQDEEDLAVSVFPPLPVQWGLESHGRTCSYRIEDGFLWDHQHWDKNRPLRDWLLRKGRVELHSAARPIPSNQTVDAVKAAGFRGAAF